MRVAFVQLRTSYFIGGSEKISLIHAELLKKKGYTVNLFTIEHPAKKRSFLFEDFLKKHPENVSVFDIPKNFDFLYDIEQGQDENRLKTESLLFNTLIFKSLESYGPDVIMSYYLPDSVFKPLNAKNVLYLGGYPPQKINKYVPLTTSFLFCKPLQRARG